MPELYDAAYYAHSCGADYFDAAHWTPFFGQIAERIIATIHPNSVLDAGCATGYLVEAFRERGTKAYGIDASEFAMDNLRPGAVGNCWKQSLIEPLHWRFALVTCIEVLEHIPAHNAHAAIGNLCRVTDDVIFTSTPDDFTEPTHCNVQPAPYWIAAFAEYGFVRDPDFDGSFICGWAMRFRRP